MSVVVEQLDMRYPIGHFDRTAANSAANRSSQIGTLRALPERLTAAVAGLTDLQLDTPYREGGWTVRQVVHHVADSHANAYIRTRLALTEDWPAVKGYDEAAWAELSDARSLPVGVSLDLIHCLHARWVVLLASLGDKDFARGYVHSEYGRTSLAEALSSYDWHSRHHTAHILNLRSRMGW